MRWVCFSSNIFEIQSSAQRRIVSSHMHMSIGKITPRTYKWMLNSWELRLVSDSIHGFVRCFQPVQVTVCKWTSNVFKEAPKLTCERFVQSIATHTTPKTGTSSNQLSLSRTKRIQNITMYDYGRYNQKIIITIQIKWSGLNRRLLRAVQNQSTQLVILKYPVNRYEWLSLVSPHVWFQHICGCVCFNIMQKRLSANLTYNYSSWLQFKFHTHENVFCCLIFSRMTVTKNQWN